VLDGDGRNDELHVLRGDALGEVAQGARDGHAQFDGPRHAPELVRGRRRQLLHQGTDSLLQAVARPQRAHHEVQDVGQLIGEGDLPLVDAGAQVQERRIAQHETDDQTEGEAHPPPADEKAGQAEDDGQEPELGSRHGDIGAAQFLRQAGAHAQAARQAAEERGLRAGGGNGRILDDRLGREAILGQALIHRVGGAGDGSLQGQKEEHHRHHDQDGNEERASHGAYACCFFARR